MEEVGLVFFGFDAAGGGVGRSVGAVRYGCLGGGRRRGLHLLRHDLASCRADVVQIGVPQFEHGLPLEPAQAHEEAVYDAGAVILPASFFGGHDDLLRYDGAVGFCDFPFLELAGDDLFDLEL